MFHIGVNFVHAESYGYHYLIRENSVVSLQCNKIMIRFIQTMVHTGLSFSHRHTRSLSIIHFYGDYLTPEEQKTIYMNNH